MKQADVMPELRQHLGAHLGRRRGAIHRGGDDHGPEPPRRGNASIAAELEALRGQQRVSNIEPSYRTRLSQLVRGSRAPAAPLAPASARPLDAAPRDAAAGARHEGAQPEEEQALELREMKRRVELERVHELREVEERQRVVSLLNSAFRADLEEIVSIHYELATQGVTQAALQAAQQHAGLPPPVVSPPLPPPPPPAAAADVRGGGARREDLLERRLAAMEGSLTSHLTTLASRWQAQAAETRQLQQLLQASFSLGLSLQEQQARTAAALAQLAQHIHSPDAAPRPPPLHPARPAERADAAPAEAAAGRGCAEADPRLADLLRDVCDQQHALRRELRASLRKPKRARAARGLGAGRRAGTKDPAASALRSSSGTALDMALEPARRCGRASPAAPPSPPPPPAGQASTCSVCRDAPTQAVLYRCGHQCACMQCAYYLHSQRLPCPICRAPIDDVVRVYVA